jgi:hypothetical protein
MDLPFGIAGITGWGVGEVRVSRDGVVRLIKEGSWVEEEAARGECALQYIRGQRMCGYCVWMYVHVHFVRIYRVKILRVAERMYIHLEVDARLFFFLLHALLFAD